ncbi:hypothetical protein E2C01_021467 [Portunus trituberculatus]|uniref:Uncharacterized protein n=1 Tax=Portunus trituberculatus TaxID=210409 RepID=A0A5B7E4J2_PORTR|nr:hypothetical protein [Portunus trituberculatus]
MCLALSLLQPYITRPGRYEDEWRRWWWWWWWRRTRMRTNQQSSAWPLCSLWAAAPPHLQAFCDEVWNLILNGSRRAIVFPGKFEINIVDSITYLPFTLPGGHRLALPCWRRNVSQVAVLLRALSSSSFRNHWSSMENFWHSSSAESLTCQDKDRELKSAYFLHGNVASVGRVAGMVRPHVGPVVLLVVGDDVGPAPFVGGVGQGAVQQVSREVEDVTCLHFHVQMLV